MTDSVQPAPDELATGGAPPTVETPSNQVTSRSVRIWQLLIIGILVLFVGLLAMRLVQTKTSEQRAAGEAPPFAFTTFDGQTISLDDLKGSGVVLNFWASWCDPCRDEAALLEQAWQQEKDNGIVFLGLDYLDQEPAAKAYLDEYSISYPNGPDLKSEAARRYGIKGVPETFFIDGEGKIKETVIGPITDPTRMQTFLDEIRPVK
jgi:cytochrome c biogenesis protein CcmG/thiol:disulfide interchange protein DsbE